MLAPVRHGTRNESDIMPPSLRPNIITSRADSGLIGWHAPEVPEAHRELR